MLYESEFTGTKYEILKSISSCTDKSVERSYERCQYRAVIQHYLSVGAATSLSSDGHTILKGSHLEIVSQIFFSVRLGNDDKYTQHF